MAALDEDTDGRMSGVTSPRWDRCRYRDQLRKFPEILGCGGEVEFVAGAVRAAQSQPIKPQDAFGVSEQHLDFLSLSP